MAEQPSPNPFTQRGMIRDPGQFFGRRTELNHIFDRLRKMQSVSVVGERRIGKSSLLYHVFQTGRERIGAGVLLVYTDLPDVKDETGFYGRACQALGVEGNDFGSLERVVRERKVAVCLDEFEKVAGQPGFSRGFFDSLRSLAQSGNFALLITTQHSLADLCRNEQIATSPFWNIFARVDLGLFVQEEAEAFVPVHFRAAGVSVTAEEIVRVLQMAGRFPFFLQLACYHLFEAKTGRTPDWETAFVRDPDVHDQLRYLWEHLTPQAQAALRWVMDLGGKFPDDRLLWDLERRGLLVRDSRMSYGYWVFSEAFENVVKNLPPKSLKRRLSIRIKRLRITFWPPSIEVEGEGGQTP
ncbi:MAG: hypothetical protein A3F84_09665 [Candidatus Handelsmanbacteria bacterium RIFCSPLOWO2_12_FULL_64_10]|uniref:Novel STAND NTPase 2 domain-containing protein n=1 Tax=Handelsmanbacteria sp. (strain RIFCSPLOWO2_12_FULL_64_10) TaxID=1817868 RepID=A0A1F6CNL7_HANXR|nr:MAG: hypothetical protein A3F84_09665 [Candidatus Handelsmanbacteria bacterium RIFCSPLOWO2_12_FULL_64_10]